MPSMGPTFPKIQLVLLTRPLASYMPTSLNPEPQVYNACSLLKK